MLFAIDTNHSKQDDNKLNKERMRHPKQQEQEDRLSESFTASTSTLRGATATAYDQEMPPTAPAVAPPLFNIQQRAASPLFQQVSSGESTQTTTRSSPIDGRHKQTGLLAGPSAASPLFQISTTASPICSSAAPTGGTSTSKAPLFSLLSSEKSRPKQQQQQQQPAPLFGISSPQPQSSTGTSTSSEVVSLSSAGSSAPSSASNSQSSFLSSAPSATAAAPTTATPRTTAAASSSSSTYSDTNATATPTHHRHPLHRSSTTATATATTTAKTTTPSATMNPNLLEGNSFGKTRRSGGCGYGGLLMAHKTASSPDIFASAGGGAAAAVAGAEQFSYPTLHQVKQQSSLRRSMMINIQQQQQRTKATLERVTRLAARMCGVPVAVITSSSSTSSVSELEEEGASSPTILSHYGMTNNGWKSQVVKALRSVGGESKQQSSSSSCVFSFVEHIPLLHHGEQQQQQQRVGTLTLLDRDHRHPLSSNEQEDLQDLCYLAVQALTAASSSSPQSSPPSPTLPSTNPIRRQVSNASDTASTARVQRIRRLQRRHSGGGLEDDDDEEDDDRSTASQQQEQKHEDMVVEQHQQGEVEAEVTAASLSPMEEEEDDDDEPEDAASVTAYHSNIAAGGVEEDPSQCIIACTAHDLLTPLMGLQLSLSLLQEDSKFVRHLEEQPHQRESFWTAWQSTEVMYRMCQTTIDTLRANKLAAQQQQQQQQQQQNQNQFMAKQRQPHHLLTSSTINATPGTGAVSTDEETEVCNLDVTVLLQSLQRLLDPIPKQVPLIMTLESTVPNQVPIITESTSSAGKPNSGSSLMGSSSASSISNTVDWHILRCALTVLSYACRVSVTATTPTTASGTGASSNNNDDGGNESSREPIHMKIRIDEDSSRLVVECHHDCPSDDDDMEKDYEASSTWLALQSVAHQMQAVYQGRHGFERRGQGEESKKNHAFVATTAADEEDSSGRGREVFWFSVPTVVVKKSMANEAGKKKNDHVITLLPQSFLFGHDNNDEDAQHPVSGDDDLPDLTPMSDKKSELGYRRSSTTGSSTPSLVKWKLRQQQQQPPNPMSPSAFQGRGLRRLRRSSTGSTNTLGGRRRTFHDMAGLRNEEFSSTATRGSSTIGKYMVNASATSKRRSRNNEPLTLPKAQSAVPANSGGSLRPLAGHKRNFQYPVAEQSQGGASTSTTANATAPLTTAQSAMAAAFQASLHNISMAQLGGQENRMSYSILQEEQHQEPERLLPLMVSSGIGAGIGGSERIGSIANTRNRSGGGLDRCFKDLMGSSARTADEFPQRVRDRLHNVSRGSFTSSGKPSLSSASTSQRERKALVIEDSLVIRKTLARALTKLGIQTVVQACDGLEGVARMQEDVYDITLCDFSMPNLGGIDCVKQYRQWEKDQSNSMRPKQYVVGMSAHASPEDIAQALQVGMNEYHPKPLTIKRLTELLQSPPLQEARHALDREWQRRQMQSMTSMPLVTPPVAPTVMSASTSLFAEFTNSTVTMLDAMSGSGRSVTVSSSYEDDNARMDNSSVKRPKTESLFSMITN